METNLIVEAFKFMGLGMGIVVLFLIIMIFAIKIQAKLIGKYFPAKESIPNKLQASNASNNTTNKIAAIVAAVQHHKNLKG